MLSCSWPLSPICCICLPLGQQVYCCLLSQGDLLHPRFVPSCLRYGCTILPVMTGAGYFLLPCLLCPCTELAPLSLQGLEDVIGLSVTHPTWQRTKPNDPEDKHAGWTFAKPGDPPFANPIGDPRAICSRCQASACAASAGGHGNAACSSHI